MLFIVLFLAILQGVFAYHTLTRTRRIIDAIDVQRLRVIDLQRVVIGEEIAIEKALEQASNHFRGKMLGTSIDAAMSLRDAVLVHPATREVFLSHRSHREKLAWDTTIAEFARQNDLDLDELLHELKTKVPW